MNPSDEYVAKQLKAEIDNVQSKVSEYIASLTAERDALKKRVEELEEWIELARPLLQKFHDCENITDIDEEELDTLLEEQEAQG